jgi:hypothetical protein
LCPRKPSKPAALLDDQIRTGQRPLTKNPLPPQGEIRPFAGLGGYSLGYDASNDSIAFPQFHCLSGL